MHAFVYEPTSGQATKLPVDFRSRINELRSVYDLYSVDGFTTEVSPSAAPAVAAVAAASTPNPSSVPTHESGAAEASHRSQ